jgi:hypothetical protein
MGATTRIKFAADGQLRSFRCGLFAYTYFSLSSVIRMNYQVVVFLGHVGTYLQDK